MKTPDEIKIWLATEIAVHYHLPNPEPRLTPKEFMLLEKMHGETLAYIEWLESRLAQVERERNAAVRDLTLMALRADRPEEAFVRSSVCTESTKEE